MQAAGLLLVLLLDLSDFLQEKKMYLRKKEKGDKEFLEGKEKRIRSALPYIQTIFIIQKIVLISYSYVDHIEGSNKSHLLTT